MLLHALFIQFVARKVHNSAVSRYTRHKMDGLPDDLRSE